MENKIALQLDGRDYRMIIYRPNEDGSRVIHLFIEGKAKIIKLSHKMDCELFEFMLDDLSE